ncbi:MAG: septum formation initiator family protein [Acidobacteriota bacterium]
MAGRIPLGARVLAAAVLALALLLALRFLVADDGYPALLVLRNDLRKVQGEVNRLRLENKALEGQVKGLRDEPYAIEKLAREDLDLAAPGEMIYLFPEDAARKTAPIDSPRPDGPTP